MIHEISYVQLENQQGYLILPNRLITLDALCKNQLELLNIQKPSLVSSTQDCTLTTQGAVIKLKSTSTTEQHTVFHKDYLFPVNETDLNLVQDQLEVLQHHVDTNELKGLATDLDDIQTQIDAVKYRRRTRSWTETSWDSLRYLGYASIALITIWSLNKVGLFTIIRSCLPPLCLKFKICCNKQQNHYHSEPAVHYRPSIERLIPSPPPYTDNLVAIPKSRVPKV